MRKRVGLLIQHDGCTVLFEVILLTKTTMKGTVFANATIWAAMIVSDLKNTPLLSKKENVKVKSIDLRRKQAEETTKSLPFPVEIWPSIHVPGCPEAKPRMIPRSSDMSHYQIWHHWEYEGRFGFDKAIASDTDLLVVFEGDAVVTVTNITRSLEQELAPKNIRSDLMLLGLCYENTNQTIMPICLHAYAITRKGVKKLLRAWDICTLLSVDNEMKQIASQGVITWQQARPTSYTDRLEEFRNESSVQKGLFVQKKGLGALNKQRHKDIGWAS